MPVLPGRIPRSQPVPTPPVISNLRNAYEISNGNPYVDLISNDSDPDSEEEQAIFLDEDYESLDVELTQEEKKAHCCSNPLDCNGDKCHCNFQLFMSPYGYSVPICCSCINLLRSRRAHLLEFKTEGAPTVYPEAAQLHFSKTI